ncbi:MAG: NAD(P)-binding domain-containing protein [Bacteroidales bacterium]|nr:NAD(P)-binding domain-containing protein [Bacteroidales bacterium]MDT8374490.1 NAD(P)-binding domain-containing protein [Bacteroidales bacterium]
MMKIGFIGLGKMGYNMVQRLLNDKHQVVVWNIDPAPVKSLDKLAILDLRLSKTLLTNCPIRKYDDSQSYEKLWDRMAVSLRKPCR